MIGTEFEILGEGAGILYKLAQEARKAFGERKEALQLLQEFTAVAKEGYLELSLSTLETLGLPAAPTREAVYDYVEKSLRESQDIAVVYHTFDAALSPVYRVHIISGKDEVTEEPVSLKTKLDGIDLRRDYFRSDEVTFFRHSPRETRQQIQAEADEICASFRKAHVNFHYYVCERGEEKELIAETISLTVEERLDKAAQQHDRSR